MILPAYLCFLKPWLVIRCLPIQAGNGFQSGTLQLTLKRPHSCSSQNLVNALKTNYYPTSYFLGKYLTMIFNQMLTWRSHITLSTDIRLAVLNYLISLLRVLKQNITDRVQLLQIHCNKF